MKETEIWGSWDSEGVGMLLARLREIYRGGQVRSTQLKIRQKGDKQTLFALLSKSTYIFPAWIEEGTNPSPYHHTPIRISFHRLPSIRRTEIRSLHFSIIRGTLVWGYNHINRTKPIIREGGGG